MRFRISNIIILLIPLVIFFSCNSDNDGISTNLINNPNTASGKGDRSVLPAFTFTEDTHDFHSITEGETVSYNFNFTNSGKSDLIISDVSTSCGCAVTEFPKTPIRPGGKGAIKVSFNSAGKHGYQTKSIVIVANTQPNVTQLKIKAQVVAAGNQK
ncbi:MAG TPA: DUF1573 domain-containing protein [Bacteroidales bacterium]|nr:DUF1573 domain-containing protein [Bacteroidales bacterium]